MGRLLAALIADSGTAPAAIPANAANITPTPTERFANSRDSQGMRVTGAEPDTGATRIRMLELAAAAYMDAAPVRALSESFLRDCEGMADDALRALLSMLRDNADRRAGRAPAGDTAAIMCQACGPVFVHPSIAAVLPVVDGWPRALGCPWCFIRKAGLYVPRPPVTCASCRYFKPDTINPAQGMGRCTVDAARAQDPPTYPSTSRHCDSWRPTEPDDD